MQPYCADGASGKTNIGIWDACTIIQHTALGVPRLPRDDVMLGLVPVFPQVLRCVHIGICGHCGALATLPLQRDSLGCYMGNLDTTTEQAKTIINMFIFTFDN